MGGGGGGTFSRRSPEDLIRQVRRVEDETSVAQFETRLSAFLSELLAACNERDAAHVQDRLVEVKGALEDELTGTFDQLFGGSVAKHTFVNGLSDVDSLLVLNGTDLEKHSPREALIKIGAILRERLENIQGIELGRMAVTITYADGLVLQVLPAIRTAEGRLRVPSSRRDAWSDINPETFQAALTRRNEECNSKLVPTIKLAKAVIGELPEPQRLSGYHTESLAIDAFRGYDGAKTTAAMLPMFFERAKDLVLTPIRDSTGQSIHVDAYLGDAGSSERQAMSHVLGRIAKRMRNASVSASEAQWRNLFGFDDE